MGLLGTIQQSSGALQAAEIGLQVVGNNIANANTPGYIRQQLQQSSASGVRVGGLIKGHGVRTTGITQVVDEALAERMFNAQTSLAGSETLELAYSQLEELTSDLNNTGLSQQLTLFNNSLHELSAQPGDSALRDFVVLQGETLASSIKRTRNDVLERRELWNGELEDMVAEINRLTERIAKLNLDISTIEGGGVVRSDATGLRDQRYRDLQELSKFVDINMQEQESGSVTVFVGGDYLINNSIRREVYSAYNQNTEGNEIRIIETDSPLQAKEGTLVSTMTARDRVFGDFAANIDSLAASLIRSVNEVHSQGQGRRGYDRLISSNIADSGVPLEEAGLPWEPRNGSFDMNVVDERGQVISSHRINVQRLGQVDDSTITSIVADIDAIEGIQASVTSDGRIEILSDSPTARFTFGEDTSSFLAAAGINIFFEGRGGFDIKVNDTLVEDSDYLAISSSGIGEDTDALAQLIDLVDEPLDQLEGRSIRGSYEGIVSSLGQKIALQQNATEGLKNFYSTLESQHLAITGVNIDEESIRMIAYQRAFQASSRVIATASEMLELLVAL